jgi:DNA-3-methyladenine glycosylase II
VELPYKDIVVELRKMDPVLKQVIASTSQVVEPEPVIDTYRYLLNSIVSQQLSVKVADVIWNRFIDLFPDRQPLADAVLATEDEKLRAIGLSRQKLKYLKNVAEFSLENDITIEGLLPLSDEEIIQLLTQISGVGKWTVQMVLMFPLDRPDVFPVDDLGIQTKMKYWYQLNLEKKALKAELEKIAAHWMPYRSLASKYLWSSIIQK